RQRGPGSAAASSVFSQPVADASHRLDGAPPERAVDLLPQPPYVDLDDVRAWLVGEVPRVLDQVEARQHLAAVAHERLEQRELLGREVDRLPAPAHLP